MSQRNNSGITRESGWGSMTEPSGGVLIFVFGATGDLAQRKLYPALYRLFCAGLLGERFAVIGMARRERTHEAYAHDVKQAVQTYCEQDVVQESLLRTFSQRFTYFSLDIHDQQALDRLAIVAQEIELAQGLSGNRLIHLALAPDLFETVIGAMPVLRRSAGWLRLVIEKPFGTSLATATALQRSVLRSFSEEEIYRIDHYLGKHTVRSLRWLRQDPLWAPYWNADHITHMHISLLEEVGVEQRGGYYDASGALRDMVQNHMLQLVSLLAMDAVTAERSLREATADVLRSIQPWQRPEDVRRDVVRGQYVAGTVAGQSVVGYRTEPHVNPHTNTETFVAMKLLLDSPQWRGTPIYVRTGKRMRQKRSMLSVHFRDNTVVPQLVQIGIHPEGVCVRGEHPEEGRWTEWIHRQPIERVKLDAYARLFYEALMGDKTYFVHWGEVEAAWRWIDPVLEAWKKTDVDLTTYVAGSDGPLEAEQLVARDHVSWEHFTDCRPVGWIGE